MKSNRYIIPKPPDSASDRIRRKRDFVLIGIVMVAVGLLSYLTIRPMMSGMHIPISNMIMMFILININMLLIILLIFLVFRNIVKLFYERRSRVPGTKLRTKLVAAFISLSLLPAGVLFAFSLHFITTSIEFWFQVPIEQALDDSLAVGRSMYQHVENNNRFFLEKAAYQIETRNLLEPEKKSDLDNYIQIVQREFNLDAVEAYNHDFKRLTSSTAERLPEKVLSEVDANHLKKALTGSAKTSSTSELLSHGELIRNISAVPFGAKEKSAEGFVVISVLLPADMAEHLQSISRGLEEYKQTKMLKQPIRMTYYITLSVVAMLVVFCAIWVGMYLSRSITIPIMELAEGTRKVAEGDLTYNINVVADDEMKALVDSFNKMTRQLRFNRRELEYSARKLYEQNMEIEDRRRYMEIVLNNVSTGVISIDANGMITTINASAEQMLRIDAADVIKKNYRNLFEEPHPKLAAEITERFSKHSEDSVSKSLNLSVDGQRRSFKVNFNSLKDESGRHMGIVMVFDDLTELEKAQRMAAWREVARRIAHEVKNPLTPISLSAQRLKRKYQKEIKDPVFEECTQTIIDHTDMIRNLVNEFSSFARFPTAEPVPCELSPIIHESVALYREGHPEIEFSVRIADNLPQLNIDRQQIKQSMINLIDNGIAAIQDRGRISITADKDETGENVRITVADTGSGVSAEDKPYLFDPDFTTKKSGMGLGLAIVSTIVADHHGRIITESNDPQGTKFIIELPV
ncbi:MAG: PAS domain-containing protein [Desulfobacteraceae bacterium]|nr:PAS domain-containing protein [Desulfobacteraceae bacterium]MCF8093937.1 PAS domain-containing protein [Desulfobacteraceae bacterium]